MRITLALLLALPLAAAADTAEDLMKQARAALAGGKTDEALALAGKAIAAAPQDAGPYLFRGSLHETLEKHAEAVADYSKAIALDPKRAEAYDRRGSEQFKRGNIKESLADFDRYLELQPEMKAGHWKRGITCYYVGQFEEGKKQFNAYEKVDTNDVENAVWHFLCNARLVGVEKAQTQILKIGKDRRVPMMQIYELFAGKIKPDDVLKAVKEGDPDAKQLNYRLFYAHLYLGLYAEASGDKKKALEHLAEAEKHKIGHYMWDVAHVHADLLRK